MAAVYFDTAVFESPEYLEVAEIIPETDGMLLRLEIWLWEQPTHALKRKHVGLIARTLGKNQASFEHFVEAGLSSGLYVETAEGITSPRINSQIEGYKKRVRGLKGHSEESSTPLRQRDDNVTVTRQDKIRQDNIGQDKEGKDKTGQDSKPEPQPEVQPAAAAPVAPQPRLKMPPPPWMKWLPDAERELELPDDQPWTRGNLFVNLGRRPMRKYPKLHLSPPELSKIIDLYNEKLAPGEWRRAFELAESHINHQHGKGKAIDFSNPHAALSTWVLSEVLEVFRKELMAKAQLKRMAA